MRVRAWVRVRVRVRMRVRFSFVLLSCHVLSYLSYVVSCLVLSCLDLVDRIHSI